MFSRTRAKGSSFVSPVGGFLILWISSSGGEQHMLPAQAFPQARLQAGRARGDGSSLWMMGEASPRLFEEAPAHEVNSG